MSAYGISKTSKEHVEVYSTDETYKKQEVADLSRKSIGILNALNGSLGIYLSGTVSSSSIPSGSEAQVSVTMSGSRKNAFIEDNAWKGITHVFATVVQGEDEPDDINELVQFAGLEANGSDTDMIFHMKNLDAVEKVIQFKFAIIQIR